MNTLVVYYSRTGKTKFVAEKVATKLKAEIEEVLDLKNRSGRIGFLKAGYDATRGNETKSEKLKSHQATLILLLSVHQFGIVDLHAQSEHI